MTWGAWGKQLTKNEMAEWSHHSIENGITTFDHADIYGDYTNEGEQHQEYRAPGEHG